MRLNLRTIITIVILITTLAVVYINITLELILIAVSILLLFLINPHKHNRLRIWHRIRNLGILLLVIVFSQILFRRSGDVIFSWYFIKITEQGLTFGIAIALRYLLIIIVAGLLLDIPFSEYLKAFRAWKFPVKLTFLLISTIHFTHIFQKNLSTIQENLLLREINLKSLSWRNKFKAIVTLIFPLVGKSLSEIKFRSAALELRGFGYSKTQTILFHDRLKWYDYLIQFTVILIFLLLLLRKII